MPTAKLDDPGSIAAAYPRALFERDAAANALPSAPVRQGVKILSQPDAAGFFELEPAAQHVGESDPEGDAVFLAPQRGEVQPASAAGADREMMPSTVPARTADDAYAGFLADIARAARAASFKPPVGRGDARLRGLRGG